MATSAAQFQKKRRKRKNTYYRQGLVQIQSPEVIASTWKTDADVVKFSRTFYSEDFVDNPEISSKAADIGGHWKSKEKLTDYTPVHVAFAKSDGW